MSTFDQLLGKLSELVGGPQNAFAATRALADPVGTIAKTAGNALVHGAQNEFSGAEARDRGAQMPIANWPDGPGLAVPQNVFDLFNSGRQFNNAAEAARGIPHTAEESFPRDQDAILAGAAMLGPGLLSRNAISRSVAGAERAEASSGLPSHSVEAGRLASNPPEAAPTGAVVSGFDQRLNLMRAAIDELNPSLQQTWRGDLDPGRFGVPSPFEFVEGQPYRRAPDSGQQVMVDLAKLKTNQPDVSGYAVKDIAERGPDPSLTPTRAAQSEPTVARLEDGSYLVLGGNHRLSAAALKGETTAPATIFSNPPDAVPAGLLATGGGEHHSRRQPRSQSGQFVTPDSFDGKLHSFNKVLVDLDGDGTPDAVMPAPEPTNAMAAMRGRR
jgi:hypothetical protein